MGTFADKQKLALDEVNRVFGCLPEQEAEPLLEALLCAQRIFLVGAGREGLATRSFAMRLAHLGKGAHWLWDDTTPGLGEGDLLLCSAGYAGIGHLVYVCEQAKKHGASVALVTASREGPLLELADVSCRLPAQAFKAQGEFVTSAQTMGNLFEQSLWIFYDICAMTLQGMAGVADHEMEKRHRNVE